MSAQNNARESINLSAIAIECDMTLLRRRLMFELNARDLKPTHAALSDAEWAKINSIRSRLIRISRQLGHLLKFISPRIGQL